MYLSTENLSINEVDNKQPVFEIFPNPADDYVSIHTRQNKGTLYFNDLSGRTANVYPIETSTTKIDLINLTPGIYFAVFVDEQHNFVGQQRVVVR